MQPPYTQPAYGQYQSTPSHHSGSGYPSPPGVTDFMMPVFAQRVAPPYHAPRYNTDIYSYRLGGQPAVRTGPEYGNDAYVYGGGPVPGYGPYHAMARSWGSSALPWPQPPQNSDYSMPSMLYNNVQVRQGVPHYARYLADTEQFPGPSTRVGFSPHLPQADPRTCWVNHAEGHEAHLTYGNVPYGGGSIPDHGLGSGHAMAGPWGTPAPQPLQNGEYPMPNIPYSGELGQGGAEPYYAGYPFAGGEQFPPGPSTRRSSSPHPPEAEADPGQDAPAEWPPRTYYQPPGGR